MARSIPRRMKKLNELGAVARGKSKHRPRDDKRLFGGLYPFVQTSDVRNANLYLTEYTQTYNDFGLAQSKLWEPDTLCITIAANIADTAILGMRACFPDSVVGFTADPNEADVRFVKYYIDTIKLHMQAVSHGTTQDNLSLDKLLRFDFSVPEVAHQHRIADVLSAFDNLIENNTKRIKILEEMARSLYREWFLEFRFPGQQRRGFARTASERVPDGWGVRTIRDVACDVDYGHTASASTEPVGPKFLRITDIVPSSIDWDAVPHCPPLPREDKYQLQEGDIVVARTGATTGYAKRLNKLHPRSVFASYLVRVRLPDSPLSHLVGTLMESDEYKAFIKRNLGGAAQPQANAQVLTSFPFALPPRDLQLRYAAEVSPMRDAKELLEMKNARLRTIRDLLLPRLLSGEIELHP